MATTSGDRAATVASMLNTLVESKYFIPDGETLEAKAGDMGKAFAVLYAAVHAAEHAKTG